MAANTTQQSTTCTRCGRTLTSPASIARGYGKGCAARLRAAAADLDGYSTAQVDAARELIADGGIVRLRGRILLTVATDGQRVHRTTSHHCTCHAGIRGVRCYHTAAARLALAA